MAEEEHARWEEVVTGKEVQLQGLQEGMEQLEVGLERARRDILPQLRIHKVCTRPPLPAATPLTATCPAPLQRESALQERRIRTMREEMPKMESSVEVGLCWQWARCANSLISADAGFGEVLGRPGAPD